MPGEQHTPTASRTVVVVLIAALITTTAVLSGIVLASAGGSRPQAAVSGGHHMEPGHLTSSPKAGLLDVSVGDYWFRPSSKRLKAGVYRFATHNYGVVQHDVMIERAPIKFSAPGAPIDEAAPFGVDGLQPASSKATTVMLTPGRWEIFCSVPGHYQSGQHETVEVYGHMPRGMRVPKSEMDDTGSGAM
jgi:uncharacterized cupredoxin-like copper-binding protein